MNVRAWFNSETWDLPLEVWALVVATATAATLLCVGASASAGAAGTVILAPLILLLLTGRRPTFDRPGLTTTVAACCWIYACLSFFWAADAGFAARALLIAGVAITAIHISRSVHAAMPDEWLLHMTRTVLVVYVIFATYGLIEEMLDHPIKRVVFWPFQAVRLVDGWPALNWDHVTRVRVSRSNWNVANMSLLLWPVLLMLRSHVSDSDRRWMAPVLIAAVLAMVLFSNHETSMVALLIGLAIFAIAQVSVRSAAMTAAVGWCLAVLAVVPVTQILYERKMHLEPSVPLTLQHRFVIWGYTANQIPKRPWFGVGVGSTKPLDEARPAVERYKRVDGTKFQWRTGAHPHNIFLQVLYEFGAVGGALFIALGLAIVWTASRLPNPFAAHNLAAFTTAAVLSSSTFGLFELWYVAALAVTPIVLSLAAVHAARAKTDE